MARAERIARPARTDEFEVVAAEWDKWAKQDPNALATAYDQLATNPTQLSSRQKRLQGKTFGSGTYEGKSYDRWQYEATAGGRIFYFVDDPTDGGRKKLERKGRGPKRRRRVVIEAVHSGHPKQTERKRG